MIPTFEEFFEAVWEYPPHPWQTRLAARIRSEGWPAILDLPTGSGKTAILDIALHHLAADEGKTAPRRIVLVVDRRVIVNQVAERARKLRAQIENGTGALAEVRAALEGIVGGQGPLLECPVLRGGMVQSDDWAQYPHVPVLAASTVDQIGSRLLFRGYGVSDRMRPVHAGLVGCDTLFLLDEVHLSRPFADTLSQLQYLRPDTSPVPGRTGVVQLSATPGLDDAESESVFHLAPADRRSRVLAAVLEAHKPTALEMVKVRARDPEPEKRAAVADRAAEIALEMAEEGRQAVALVVNRVDTARRVWGELHENPTVQVELITGRMRPLDQEAVLDRITPRVMAGRDGETTADLEPLLLVATQCIEAGADYDFDGMVTECASLDALRQRFGRVDRRGQCVGRIGQTARAVLLARSDIRSASAPVYGDALKNTWEWLDAVATDGAIDFGIEALQPHLDALGEHMDNVLAPRRPAPVALPTYLDQWAQTNPRPHADPDVSLFLHGIPLEGEQVIADVQVVWRADIAAPDLEVAASDDDAAASKQDALLERLASVPPASLEAVALPIWAIRKWLADGQPRDEDDDLADVEGMMRAPAVSTRVGDRVVVWRGRRKSKVARVDEVRPGDTIVVPAERGGLGMHRTFDPDSAFSVPDLGDVAQLRQRGRASLRLDQRVWAALAGIDEAIRATEEDRTLDPREMFEAVLDDVTSPASEAPERLVELIEALGSRPIFRQLDDQGWLAIRRRPRRTVGRQRSAPSLSSADGGETLGGGEEDDESFLGAAATLSDHLEGVAELASFFARAVRLPDPLVTTLRWAGLLHDIGKADLRFQLLLHGGDEISARFGDALAKSVVPWQDRPARQRARAVAGYPDRQRHELVSLDMIEGCRALEEAVAEDGGDWELLLHLVAAHHGWCRPLAPPVTMPEDHADAVEWSVGQYELKGSTRHERGRLNSGVARRFFALIRGYGWHELAYLEAILRLADHRRSAREEER